MFPFSPNDNCILLLSNFVAKIIINFNIPKFFPEKVKEILKNVGATDKPCFFIIFLSPIRRWFRAVDDAVNVSIVGLVPLERLLHALRACFFILISILLFSSSLLLSVKRGRALGYNWIWNRLASDEIHFDFTTNTPFK